MTLSRPAGVILAGGLATRMGGGDKALQRLAGVTLLDRVIARLAPQVAKLALNANGDPARFGALALPVLPDPVPGHPGPLAGVLAALDWAAGRGDALVMTVAADTPFLPGDLVARLLQAADGGTLSPAVAATQGPSGDLIRHPTCALWPVALRADLRAALADGMRKVTVWADRHGAQAAVFGAGEGGVDPFFNVNTPDDLHAAEAFL